MAPSKPHPPSPLLPLILGTATFNTQYVADPQSMPYRAIVAHAVSLGVTAFDTWIRYSVLRSLARLHTSYLDLVYLHDVEFVSPGEVLAAIRELRRLRDEEGVVRYVGISGFPPKVLAELAEMVQRETGKGLDAVLSYGQFTVQNREGGVDVVLNASMLGMGLLTSRGIPVDAEEEGGSVIAKWHPSPPELRLACRELARLAGEAGERLESVAIRWALAEWARMAADAGFGVAVDGHKVGATVCGVSSIAELEETVAEWRGVLSRFTGQGSDEKYGPKRDETVLNLVREQLWPALGEWLDYTWESGGPSFVNTRKESERGVVPDDGVIAAYEQSKQAR
ncbi:hypothetical protein N0V88_001508 [Collariella sp. IMI 366227]|nr:hypothetical protein N0V88_001508 [Collariella sp. IMI 366227]